ncbi:MAG: dockerin type I repeat-containing protein, partial [Clostridia bacterium]|nr:dockerin type I repeat-containing protein [Clostridia bacterium]
SEDAAAAVADLANDVKVMLNEAYVDAITDTYTVAPDSYYVAMGDSSVFGENTYAQKLAAELGLTTSQFINLSAAGMSVAETIGLVNANASEIAKADLITIGYSNNTMMEFVIAQLKAATGNGEAQPMDWTALVGEKLVPHVEKALADITADMLASGVDAQYAELLSVAVEAYAYAAVSHALNYPMVVGSIHEINPDALVVIVGMYNPLAGVSVRLSSTETIEIGDYVQKLIDLANMETLAYAMLAPNTIYVDAPNVTTQAQPGEIPVVNFLMGLLMNGTDKYYATEDGHAYIAQQILNALTVTKSGLLGDANNDGVVDSYDATLILQYLADYIGKEDINYAVCDVDGDGFVDSYDVTLILQYLAEYITSFPAEIQ